MIDNKMLYRQGNLDKNDSYVGLVRQPKSKIISKDLGKLIFNFDDSDNQSQCQSSLGKLEIHSSTSKLSKIKDVKGAYCNKIMPSIMQVNQYQNNYIYQEQRKQKNKCKVKTRKTLADFKIVDFDDQQNQNEVKMNTVQDSNQFVKTQRQKRKNRQYKIEQQSYRVIENPQNITKLINNNNQLNNKIHNDNENTNTQIQSHKIQLFKNGHNNKISPSQQQNNNKRQNNTKNNEQQNIESINQIHHTNQLVFNLDSEQERGQHNNERITDLPTCGDQQINTQIFNLTGQTKLLSQQLSNKIGQFQTPHNIKIFLSTPIPDEIVFTFQVHKYKNFMKTQYQFLLLHGENLTIFATAVNDKLYIQKSLFTFNVFPKNRVTKNQQKAQLFIGQFISDFKRQNWTFYDHKNQQKPNGTTDKVLCTVSTVPHFINPKLVCQEVYIPKVINKKSTILLSSSLCKNLKKMYKIKQFQNMVSRYTTHSVSNKILQQMREQFKVAKNTTRHSILKNQDGHPKLLFLKMQNSRFRIRAGSGLTPIQILCYSIVHLQ